MSLSAPENPFRITPNPRFVYPGQLDEAFEGLRAAAAEGRDGAVLAEPGMGKTLLLRMLAQEHEAAGAVRYAAAGPGFDAAPLFAPADGFLLVLIDEAHALSARELRRIWDQAGALREAGASISVILAGRPTFEPLAAEAGLLLDWFLLSGLAVEETPDLVRRRLVAAGCDEDAFAEDALVAIARRSGGVPRLVNLACSNALFRARAEQTEQVTLAHALAVPDVLDLPEPRPDPEPAQEAASSAAPSTLLGLAGAAMGERRPRATPLGWRALAGGLGLFVGGLLGMALLMTLAKPKPPALAISTMTPLLTGASAGGSEEPEGPAALPSSTSTPASIVFHYSAYDPGGRRTARRLAESLTASGLEAHGMSAVRARIDSTTVRYFFDGDLGVAKQVHDVLARELGRRGGARIQDLTHYEPKPSEGAIEIWLAGAGASRRDDDLRRVRARVAPPVLKPQSATDWP